MDGNRLATTFEAVEPFTVGLEEEVMLLDPETLELANVAPDLLARIGDRPAPLKLELPASQMELITPPRRSVPETIDDLAAARGRLTDTSPGSATASSGCPRPSSPAER